MKLIIMVLLVLVNLQVMATEEGETIEIQPRQEDITPKDHKEFEINLKNLATKKQCARFDAAEV